MGAHLDVSQLAALGVRIAGAGPAVQAGARTALTRTAYAIEGDAKVLCPVDTGNLMGSISTDVDGTTAEIGPTSDYGIYVELGTSRMAGQPFMAPAFERRVPEYVDALATIATAAF
ncbi:HK97-gp10 family putative phage morphogenesis protein [Nocardioides soli]|uniref:HK97 gp10 family phage protein n=1 Tax=Nocardioides soli TaxID=1036020 RepID=A0A7W4VT82_9ACTN|nr:HK97-gp10 family putative phage morphogenesis protein [Nocardioides soli]MBB3041220.1 HK97 gp10 family phage protein [Nocardioides soli]